MRHFYQVVGQNMLFLRQHRHMTQEDLAWSTNMDPSYLGRIERGRNITISTLCSIAAALEVEPYELLLPPEAVQKRYPTESPELQYTGD